MATNITIAAVDAQVVVTFEDGKQITVEPQSQQQFQLPTGSYCAVAEVPIDENAPKPDNELPTPPAQKFLAAWRKVVDAIKGEIAEDIGEPEVTPYKK